MSASRFVRLVRVASLPVVAGFILVACAQGADLPSLEGNADPTESAGHEGGAPGPTLPSGSDDDPGSSSSSSSGGPATDGGDDTDAQPSDPDAGTDAGALDGGPADAGACVTDAPSNACGLTPQCGCAANETCAISNTTTGAVSCILAGGAPLGSYCSTNTQCAKGLGCAYNTCRPYCETLGDACAGAGVGICEKWYEPAGVEVTNGNVCSVPCDVTNPKAACSGNNCYWDSTLGISDCVNAGDKGLFDECASFDDCGQGLMCILYDPLIGYYECEAWCRLGHDAEDCGVFSCVDVYGAAAPTLGADKLGHCQ